MFRISKQIAMVGILGLALVLATAVYTQHASAVMSDPRHRGGGGNGVIPGGSTSSQNSQGQNDNSQGNEPGSGGTTSGPSGANGGTGGSGGPGGQG